MPEEFLQVLGVLFIVFSAAFVLFYFAGLWEHVRDTRELVDDIRQKLLEHRQETEGEEEEDGDD